MSLFAHPAIDAWTVPVLPTLIAVCAATWYLAGWSRVRAASPGLVSGWHAASFGMGVVLLWIAVASPLASSHHDWLTVHMIQHLLLMTLAPPLILSSAPARSFSRGLPAAVTLAIDPLVRGDLVGRVGRLLTHPLVCWSASTAMLVIWHVPAVLRLGLHSERWHAVQLGSFLMTGLMFWWPVIQPWPSVPHPRWSIVLYLFLATLPCDILSGFLMFSERIAYPVYLSRPDHTAIAVLADQQTAAALMWTVVTLVYLVAGAILATRLLSLPHSQGRPHAPVSDLARPPVKSAR